MNERHLMAAQPFARVEVDDLGAVCGKAVDRGRHVWNLEGDVVHPRTALGEKAADGGVCAKRRQELDASVADTQVRGLDALILHAASELDPGSEQALVGRDRLVEVLDRHRDVVDGPHLHGP